MYVCDTCIQVIVKNLSTGTRVVLKSHYGYEVTHSSITLIVSLVECHISNLRVLNPRLNQIYSV